MNIFRKIFHRNIYFYVLEHSESFSFKKKPEMDTDRRVDPSHPPPHLNYAFPFLVIGPLRERGIKPPEPLKQHFFSIS